MWREYSKASLVGKGEYETVPVDFVLKENTLKRKITGFGAMVWWCHRQERENATRKKGAM